MTATEGPFFKRLKCYGWRRLRRTQLLRKFFWRGIEDDLRKRIHFLVDDDHEEAGN
jgi:hypothetical protein